MSLSLKQITAILSEETGFTSDVCHSFTKAFFENIKENFHENYDDMNPQSITFREFGSFHPKIIKPKKIAVVKKGDSLKTRAYYKVGFKPSRKFCDALKNTD